MIFTDHNYASLHYDLQKLVGYSVDEHLSFDSSPEQLLVTYVVIPFLHFHIIVASLLLEGVVHVQSVGECLECTAQHHDLMIAWNELFPGQCFQVALVMSFQH